MSEEEKPAAAATDNLISDIFGDSDDEAAQPSVPAPVDSSKPSYFDSDDDSLFGGSDDQSAKAAPVRTSKLKKNNAKGKQVAADELLDSDEDADAPRIKQRGKKASLKRKKPEDKSKSKDKNKERVGKRAKLADRAEKKAEKKEGEASGDEYDSGEDAVKTKEDDDFIDEDDEHADLVKEYDEDNDDFNDERPEGWPDKKKKPSNRSSSSAPSHSQRSSSKDNDPLSLALQDMKAPKAKAMTAAEMEGCAERLQSKMQRAKQLDDQAFARSEPATHKLALLPMVRQAVGMKALHNTLLDRDFLCNLRDWIEPRDADTLPSLAVRTAVYEMLKELPCLSEHLKRVGSGSKPIGYVIVALRRHKGETVENKRLLKDLMDKWSRPIFSNGVDTRGPTAFNEQHEEVQRAMLMKYSSEEAPIAAATGRGVAGGGSGRLDGLMDARQASKTSSSNERVRMPYSTGYLFTVQPESRAMGSEASKGDAASMAFASHSDEARAKLYKKTLEGRKGQGKGEAGAGKKSNPRAIALSVSGRNITA